MQQQNLIGVELRLVNIQQRTTGMIESYRVAGLRTSSATRILSHIEFSTPAAAGIAPSEQQAIHFSLVNTLRESEDRFGLLHRGFQLFGGEFQIQTREIVLELRYTFLWTIRKQTSASMHPVSKTVWM